MALRRRHIPEPHTDHPNVIPLVDVMLCMIVFYMLAAKIGVDNGADKSLQLAVTQLGSEMQKVGVNNIVVNVRETLGQPDVTAKVETSDSVRSYSVGGSTSGPSLRDTLYSLRLGKDGKEGTADDNADLTVIIRGDAEMSYKTFMPVMLAVTDSGVKNIWHNTAKPTGEMQNAK
jgi:biopolymer transport protein ExbD